MRICVLLVQPWSLLHRGTAGTTLGLSKCEFAQSSVKFLCHIIGSGFRGVDPNKVHETVQKMKVPDNKRDLRSIIGLFSFLRTYIPDFSRIVKLLTDLMALCVLIVNFMHLMN